MSLVVHAFDERHQRLIADLRGSRFGVALIRGDGPDDYHEIGTEVGIVDQSTANDGRMTVLAMGVRRFAVERLHEPDPYPMADVRYLSDDAAGTEELCARVTRRLRKYLAVTAESGFGGDVTADMPTEPAALSYQVASLMRLSSPERQDLLELPTAARLDKEAVLLAREADLLERIIGTERI